MGDVKLVTATRISKATLTLDHSSLRSPVLTEAPAFTLPPRNIRVPLGGTARFEGKVRGNPEPQITWYKNGHLLTGGEHWQIDRSVRGIFSLVIKGVQEDDSGPYTCEAANDGGVRQVTVELTVEENVLKKHSLPFAAKSSGGRLSVPPVEQRPSIWGECPPKFATKPNRVIVREGQTGKFSCKITGRPQPQVTWSKGDGQVQQSDHFNMYEKGGIQFLEIQNVQLADAGIYTCTVMNCAGKASVSAELMVQGSDKREVCTHPLCTSTKSTVTIKATETSPIRKATSNGIAKDLKSTTTELLLEPKDRAAVKKETSLISSKETKQSSLEQTREPNVQPRKEEKRSYQVLQKTSSTITLQAIKVSAGPKAGPNTTSLRREEDGKGPKQSGTTGWQAPSTARLGGLRTKELEDNVELKKSTTEVKRESQGIPPQFESRPESQEILEGEEVTFKCKVSGKPKANVEWFKEEARVEAGDRVQIYEEDGIHCLCLKKTVLENSGSYCCTASNDRGQTSTRWMLTVRRPKLKEVAPHFSSVLKSCSVCEGQDFVLQCSVEGTPVPQITWLLKDRLIQYAHSIFEDGVAKLTVQDALPEDDGIYTCLAENSAGMASCSAQVTVKEKKSRKKLEQALPSPASKPSPPIFIKGLTDLKVMDGSQVIMTVEVSANPPPEIIWLHNGKEIQETEDFHFEKKGNEYSLYIQEVFPEDTGTYTCEAWNDLGEARTQATLTVQEPQDGIQPWFISKPRSVTAVVGQNILISCAIAGDPFPTVHWFREGQEVKPGAGWEFLQNEDIFTLIIRNVQPRHAGQYEIQLKNQVGECSCQVSLMLRETTVARGEIFRDGRQTERRDAHDHDTLTFRSTGGFRRGTGEAQQVEDEQEDVRGVLKRRVETRESTEEKLRQQEVEQIDFRDILAKKVSTKSFSEEELKEIPAEQMDFRANLQRQVKPKALSEEERKVHSPQQVDFRAVLAKKGTPKPPVLEKAPASKPATPDFRSVLGAKKKTPTENGGPSAEAQNANPSLELEKPSTKPKVPDSSANAKTLPVSKILDNNTTTTKTSNSSTTSETKNASSKSKMQNTDTNSEAQTANTSSEVLNSKPVEKEDKNDINCEDCPVVDGGIIEEKVEDNEAEPKRTAPSFTEKLKDIHVAEGEKLVLQCRVSADPPATVTWTLDGKVIKSSKFIVLSQEGSLCSLTIDKAFPEDEGQYKCIAENTAGKAECACSVLVEGTSAPKRQLAPQRHSGGNPQRQQPVTNNQGASAMKKRKSEPLLRSSEGDRAKRQREHYSTVFDLMARIKENEINIEKSKQALENDRVQLHKLFDNYEKEIKSGNKYPGCFNDTVQVGGALAQNSSDSSHSDADDSGQGCLSGSCSAELSESTEGRREGGLEWDCSSVEGSDIETTPPAIPAPQTPPSTPPQPEVFVERVRSWHRPYERYRSLMISEEFRFRNLEHVTSFGEAVSALTQGIQEILDEVNEHIDYGDFVQFRLEGGGLQNPLFSFKKKKNQMEATEFLDRVVNMLQSNREILSSDALRLIVTISKPPHGGALRKIKSIPYSLIIEKKRRFLVDFTSQYHNLCFAAGLIAVMKRDATLTDAELLECARKLHTELGWSAQKKVALNDIVEVENHLKVNIQVVLCSDKGWGIFKTQPLRFPETYFILLHNEHYYGVLNVKALFGSRNYCRNCHMLYAHKHTCSKFCRMCGTAECQTILGTAQKCPICCMYCSSEFCFKRHCELAIKNEIDCTPRIWCSKCRSYNELAHKFKKCKGRVCRQCGAAG